MMRKAARILALSICLGPGVALALGLGNIELSSALNEPLKARIPLRGLQTGDVDGMRAILGTSEQFRRAGLDRPFLLSRLRFRIEETAPGTASVSVTSREPITEPFLSFLIEVSWPRGRILREYTVLLDPPVYGAAMSTAVKSAVVSTKPAPAAPAMPAKPAVSPFPPPLAAAPSMPSSTDGTYGPTSKTDTLWSLSTQLRPDRSISVQQMMLALLRANPEAFIRDNINTLKAGAILKVPDLADIETLSGAEALAEVRRHNAQWEDIRQGIVAAPALESTGAVTPSEMTSAAPAESTAQPDELRLLGSGQSPTAAAGGGTADTGKLKDELNLALEEVDAGKRENDDLRSRLNEADALIEDLQRLVTLREDSIAALQQQLGEGGETPAETPPVMPPVEVETPKVEAPTVEAKPEPEPVAPPKVEKPEPAEKPAAKPKRRPPPSPPKPKSFIESILDSLPVDPVILLGGLGGLLLLGGGFIMMRRRRGGAEAVEVSVADDDAMLLAQEDATEMPAEVGESITELPAAETEAPEDEDEDRTQMAAPAAETSEAAAEPTEEPAEAEEDPLAEVNVYLAYERFDQAEELVKNAIEAYPDRHEYRLKLLEIYYAAKNVAAFQAQAGALRDVVGEDDKMIEKAAGWWEDLAPGQDMFGSGVELPADMGETDGGAPASADDDIFDVTGGSELESAAQEDAAQSQGDDLDFDLGFEMSDSGETEAAGETTGAALDFDIGGGDEGASAEETAGGDLDFDFDIGGDEAAPAEAAPAPEAEPVSEAPAEGGDGGGLDFDFDIGGDEAAPAEEASAPEAEPAAEGDDGGLDLDFDIGGGDAMPAADAAPADEVPAEGGDGDGLDLDFGLDAGDSAAEPAAETAADDAGDFGLDLDIASDTPTAEEPAIDTDEVPEGAEDSMDFDLDFAAPEGDAAVAVETPPAAEEADIGEETMQMNPADLNLAGDSDGGLDLGDGTEPEVADAGSDMDFDLDLGGTEEPAESAESAEEAVLDLAAAETEINLDVPEALPEDVATDEAALDLGIPDLTLDESAGDAETADADDGLDLDLDMGEESAPEPEVALDIETDEEEDEDEDEKTVFMSQPFDTGADDDTMVLDGGVDEVQTKLELAQAFVGMGDKEAAQNILNEVIAEGSDAQQQEAKDLLASLE